jgi:hypothetical protein
MEYRRLSCACALRSTRPRFSRLSSIATRLRIHPSLDTKHAQNSRVSRREFQKESPRRAYPAIMNCAFCILLRLRRMLFSIVFLFALWFEPSWLGA